VTGQLGPYALTAIVIVTLIVVYWFAPRRRAVVVARPFGLAALLGLVAAGIGLSLWSVSLERSTLTFERQSSPLAIAIAFDLSPSMLAVPDPDFDGRHPPRFERGKRVLMEFLATLEERREPVIVTVVGFTKRASVVMGWDRSTAQVRDILDYAVAPDLFGSAGTSFEAAAKSLGDVYAMLPAALQGTERKLAIVVSDGEDTMRTASFGYAEEELAAEQFDTIALQTGFINRNEGIPVYGSVGEFTGFRPMRGELYTVPDTTAMSTLAEASLGRGLHVHAEAGDAAERMLEFTVGVEDARTPNAEVLSTLGLFVVVLLLCALILR